MPIFVADFLDPTHCPNLMAYFLTLTENIEPFFLGPQPLPHLAGFLDLSLILQPYVWFILLTLLSEIMELSSLLKPGTSSFILLFITCSWT